LPCRIRANREIREDSPGIFIALSGVSVKETPREVFRGAFYAFSDPESDARPEVVENYLASSQSRSLIVHRRESARAFDGYSMDVRRSIRESRATEAHAVLRICLVA